MTVTRTPATFALNIGDFGVKGDGTTDESVKIQTAIDTVAAAGGGDLLFRAGKTYRCINLVLKSGVTLRGEGAHFGYLPGSVNVTKFLAAGTGIVIDTPVTAITGCGVVGINIQGLGAGTAVKGVRFRDVNWGTIKRCHVNSVADEAILLDSGCGACVLEDILVINSVLNRSRAAVIGAVDIHGADIWANRIEAGISGSLEGTVQSASLYCVGIAWRAANGFAADCVGEISDIGWYVSGALNRFTSCRADLNYGHGWQIVGGGNQFMGCLGLNNSQDTTNTYSNFQATSASANNVFTGCRSDNSAAKVAKYGFEDLVSSATQKNLYVGCQSIASATAQVSLSSSSGSSFRVSSGPAKTLTVNSATPDVTGWEHFTTGNSSATTITAFTGLVPGQRLIVFCNDVNTTIQHNGSTIVLAGLGNKKLRSGIYYEFIAVSATLIREFVPFPLGVTADVGNAAKSLTARTDEETQLWKTPLTADRAVSLGTFGAYAGATFRITRTAAATGAFNLNVGTGPLKALTAGQWCDVTFDGSAWVLTAAGSL